MLPNTRARYRENAANMRRAVQSLFVTMAASLLVLLVSGGLCGLLAAVGDRSAVQAVKGVAIVALACWGLSFVAMVFLLAIAYLRSGE